MEIKNIKLKATAITLTTTLIVGTVGYALIKSNSFEGVKVAITNIINNDDEPTLYILEKQLALPKYPSEHHSLPYDGIRYSTMDLLGLAREKVLYLSPIYVVSENNDVEGWTCVGTCDLSKNKAKIYIFEYIGKEKIKLPGRHYEYINRDNNLVFTDSNDIHQFGENARNYRYYGLVDENFYDKTGFSVEDNIATIELGNVKTK